MTVGSSLRLLEFSSADTPQADTSWEADLAELLRELTNVQDELLALLSHKRSLLRDVDIAGITALEPREAELARQLEACLERRRELLDRAARAGQPSGSLRELAAAAPIAEQQALEQQLADAELRSRLLQHHSLTNWVVIQRTLLHLAQVLEIIATGGRLRPTYGETAREPAAGALVDREA